MIKDKKTTKKTRRGNTITITISLIRPDALFIKEKLKNPLNRNNVSLFFRRLLYKERKEELNRKLNK